MRPSVDLTNEAQHIGTREVSLEHAERKSAVDRPDPVWSFHHYILLSRAHKNGGGGGGGEEERVTAHPGCGPGGMVGLCLNILFTV